MLFKPEKVPDLPPTILAVGDPGGWDSKAIELETLEGFNYTSFDDLDRSCLDVIKPEVVISGLLCKSFDVIDLAEKLSKMRYQGRYRVWCNEVPNPNIILLEVARTVHALNFDILSLEKIIKEPPARHAFALVA